jgi:hypothetical protein
VRAFSRGATSADASSSAIDQPLGEMPQSIIGLEEKRSVREVSLYSTVWPEFA